MKVTQFLQNPVISALSWENIKTSGEVENIKCNYNVITFDITYNQAYNM